MNKKNIPNQTWPWLSALKSERAKSVLTTINNLKLNDVETDTAYNATISRIKQAVLFTPVTISEPKYVDHQYQHKPLTVQQQMIGGSTEYYYFKFSAGFTGSTELFNHIPESGFSIGAGDFVIEPTGRSLSIEVELNELNVERAKLAAKDTLAYTIGYTNQTSKDIIDWNIEITARIESLAAQKRQQQIAQFGKK